MIRDDTPYHRLSTATSRRNGHKSGIYSLPWQCPPILYRLMMETMLDQPCFPIRRGDTTTILRPFDRTPVRASVPTFRSQKYSGETYPLLNDFKSHPQKLAISVLRIKESTASTQKICIAQFSIGMKIEQF